MCARASSSGGRLCRLQRSYMKYGPGGADPQAGGASGLSAGHEAGGLLQASLGRPLEVMRGWASGRRNPPPVPLRRPQTPACRNAEVRPCRACVAPRVPRSCQRATASLPRSSEPAATPMYPATSSLSAPQNQHHAGSWSGIWGRRGGALRSANENKSFAGGVTEGKNGGGGTRRGDPGQTKPFFLEVCRRKSVGLPPARPLLYPTPSSFTGSAPPKLSRLKTVLLTSALKSKETISLLRTWQRRKPLQSGSHVH